ncbi:MAG: SBBP repeat-containing protein, partial [Saprospiraceae bacterium]
MKLKARVLFCLLGFFNMLNGQEKLSSSAQNFQPQVDPSFFIENKGQWPEMVLYKTSMGGMEAWITKEGIVYDFYQFKEKNDLSAQSEQLDYEGLLELRQKIGQVVNVKLQNANTPTPISSRKQPSYFNYFMNNDQSKWASNVGSFKEVRLEEVYDNIDLKYYFSQGYLRYDYIVKPGGLPNQIQFQIEGADQYFINTEGELVFETRFGEVKQKQLELYQVINGKRVIVSGKFVKSKDGIQFSVANYDKTKDLIIDPLIYATFIGGSLLDSVRDLVVDKDKNAYIVGYTYSLNFPVTSGAYDGSFGNITDCILSKFDMTGSTLLYSTYIGGDDGYDHGAGICLDTSNNIYILGSTSSSNFPITAGAFSVNPGGSKDVVILKLNNAGTTLEYSTFLGGASTDSPGDIAIDKDNNVYVVGSTDSSNFPTSTGAPDNSWNGNYDIFISKLNSLGNSLIYSTYWGGDYIDQSFGIALDSE